MEINNLNSVNTVKSTVRKQAEKVQETGLKEDTFEKNVDIDTVMKTLDGINFSNGMKKFKYEVISNKIRASLEESPQKAKYALKLAPQDNVTSSGLYNILKKPVEEVKLLTEVVTAKDKKGYLKFSEPNVSTLCKESNVEEYQRMKQLTGSVLNGDDIIAAAKEKDLDLNKLSSKAEEMSKVFPKDELIGVRFAPNPLSKGEYTIEAENYYRDSYKEMLDSNLNRYAIENKKGYITDDNRMFIVKKTNDFRTNIVSKTRLEKLDGTYRPTHEIKIFKDKKGHVKRTEYTQPSEVKGVVDVKVTYPSGKVQQVSSGKVDKKTGITTIKKNMVSSLGTKTEYLYEDDPKGNRIVDYKITDKNGKVLLNNSLTFEVVSPNKFISSKNNEKYEITSNKNKVTVKDLNNPKRTATFKRGETIQGEEDNVISLLKKVPGDELLKISEKVDTIEGISNELMSKNRLSQEGRSIETGDNLFIFLHELGHAKDLKEYEMDFLSGPQVKDAFNMDKKFNKIYENELKAFNKNHPDSERSFVSYFISNEKRSDGNSSNAKKEVIAESNALLTTAKSHEDLAMRSHYLQQHFPETIAYIHEKLNAN